MKCISSSTTLRPSTITSQHLKILTAQEVLLSDSTFKLWAWRRSLAMHLISSLLFNKLMYVELWFLSSDVIQFAHVIVTIPIPWLSPRFLGFNEFKDCQSMSVILEMPSSFFPKSVLLRSCYMWRGEATLQWASIHKPDLLYPEP